MPGDDSLSLSRSQGGTPGDTTHSLSGSQGETPGDNGLSLSRSQGGTPGDTTLSLSGSQGETPGDDSLSLSRSQGGTPGDTTLSLSGSQGKTPGDDSLSLSRSQGGTPGDTTLSLSGSQGKAPGDNSLSLSRSQGGTPGDTTLSLAGSQGLTPGDNTLPLGSSQGGTPGDDGCASNSSSQGLPMAPPKRPRRPYRRKDTRNADIQRRVEEMMAEDAAKRRLAASQAANVFAAQVNRWLDGIHIDDPVSYVEAMDSLYQHEWIEAMKSELGSLIENSTWIPVNQLSKDTQPIHPIGSKWVFRTKANADGSTRFKARLVIKGYEQREGVDYDATYAPVSRLATLRLVLAVATAYGWNIDHIDVITAFLNPPIDRDDIYMELPAGVEKIEPSIQFPIVRLRKALYGLRQAPRLWYKAIDSLLTSLGFEESTAEPNLYHKPSLLILLYVDDILLAYSDPKAATDIKLQLRSVYKMTDLGKIKRFLGMEISKLADGSYTLSQQSYLESILRRFQMEKANPVSTPLARNTQLYEFSNDHPADQHLYLQIIGALMYAALGSRPDISYAVFALSCYSHNPHTVHLTAAKRVLRDLRGTKDLVLVYPVSLCGMLELTGYTDADWANNTQDRRSIGSFLFLLGGPISWQSRKQSIIATSTLESEYSAFIEAVKEVLWLRQLLYDIKTTQLPPASAVYPPPSPTHWLDHPDTSTPGYTGTLSAPTTIFTDSERALQTVKSEGITARNKHFDIRLFKAREVQRAGIVNFTFVPGEHNAADGLTKALVEVKHRQFLEQLGMRSGGAHDR